MRVKAFSLIELIVVILLLGVIYFLVVSSYTSKQNTKETLHVNDIPNIIKGVAQKEDATLYFYSKDCDKAILHVKNNPFKKIENLSISKNYNMTTCNPYIKEFIAYTKEIEKKQENICFDIDFKNGKFFNKFILSNKKNIYLFSPIFQKVKKYDNFKDAQDACQNSSLYPTSIDGYYSE